MCEACAQHRLTVALLSYVHKLSHNVKKVAQKYDVEVVSSAPHKLSSAEGPTKRQPKNSGRSIKHWWPFVDCAEGVVYQIPFKVCKSVRRRNWEMH